MNSELSKKVEMVMDINQKLLFILGVATPLIINVTPYAKPSERQGIAWILQALDNVIYHDRPLPPMWDGYN